MAQLASKKIIEWILPSKQKILDDFAHKNISHIVVDSREATPGSLFVALKGARCDGHDFLQQAKDRGASCALVSSTYSGRSFGLSLIYHDDPLVALQTMAKNYILEKKPKIVAVTGSVGKTTTKECIYALLKTTYKVAKSSKNQNSQIGLALSVLNETEGDEDFLVLEMGMTHPGQIRKLVEIAPPDIALITQIGYVHAENFSSLEEIAHAKSEIFSHEKTALGIVNQDSECADLLLRSGKCQKKNYSFQSQLQVNWRMEVDKKTCTVFEDNQPVSIPNVWFQAPHIYSNCLASIACARSCHVPWERINQGIHQVNFPSGRLEEIVRKTITFIHDAYNASELSMKAALEMIEKREIAGKKVGILGSMRELGNFSEEAHSRLGNYALSALDLLICIGPECAPIVQVFKEKNKPVYWCTQFEDLLQTAKSVIHDHDLVLIKGARYFALERVLDAF